MLSLTDVMQPQAHEEVVAVFREHRFRLVGPLVLATIVLVAPFFWIYKLTQAGVLGLAILIVLVLSGLGVAGRALFLWDANALILSTQRLVHVRQDGFWHRVVEEVSLAAIGDLTCEARGLFETWFHVGSLRIRAVNSMHELMVTHLARPESARMLIDKLRAQVSRASVVSASATALNTDVRAEVHALIDKAPLTTLQTVKALLDKRSLS